MVLACRHFLLWFPLLCFNACEGIVKLLDLRVEASVWVACACCLVSLTWGCVSVWDENLPEHLSERLESYLKLAVPHLSIPFGFGNVSPTLPLRYWVPIYNSFSYVLLVNAVVMIVVQYTFLISTICVSAHSNGFRWGWVVSQYLEDWTLKANKFIQISQSFLEVLRKIDKPPLLFANQRASGSLEGCAEPVKYKGERSLRECCLGQWTAPV